MTGRGDGCLPHSGSDLRLSWCLRSSFPRFIYQRIDKKRNDMSTLYQYELIEEDSADNLSRTVNEYIRDGYKPMGGAQIVNHTYIDMTITGFSDKGMRFYQAVVKFYE